MYILLISRMEDIQRTFMYHGAEHKCINCIEHGLPLTVENVRKSSRQHKRCGTSFLFCAGDQYYFTVADSGGIAFDAGGCPYCTASGDRRNLL